MSTEVDKVALAQNISGLLIGVGLTLILGVVTFALIKFEIPKDNQNALLILIGILSTNIGVIVNYYFGSSRGTQKQNDTINALATTAQATQAASSPAPDKIIKLEPEETVAVSATAKPDKPVK